MTGCYESIPLFRFFQREGHDAVVGQRIAKKAAAGGGDDHILFAVAALISHGRGLGSATEFEGPQLLAVLGVERAKTAVVSGANKDKAPSRRDSAAIAWTSGVL